MTFRWGVAGVVFLLAGLLLGGCGGDDSSSRTRQGSGIGADPAIQDRFATWEIGALADAIDGCNGADRVFAGSPSTDSVASASAVGIQASETVDLTCTFFAEDTTRTATAGCSNGEWLLAPDWHSVGASCR